MFPSDKVHGDMAEGYCELLKKKDIFIHTRMTFYLNPAENKPQFVQGGKKHIENSLKRMHL